MRHRMKIVLTGLMMFLNAFQVFAVTHCDHVSVPLNAGYTRYNTLPGDNLRTTDNFIQLVRETQDTVADASYASAPVDLPDQVVLSCPERHAQEKQPFYMAIKSNMLYDAALTPNIGVEFYLGSNFSLYGEWMYSWWDSDHNHIYWRNYGGDLGVRWWFGRKAKEKPLTGHHIGLYGGVVTFDYEMGDTGYMGGMPGGTLLDRCLVNAGFEYGYSLPVAKRINIDFSIGLGCLAGRYIKYFPFDNDYFKEKEYKMRFFGPTKAEISLVWLIGRGNFNKKKGGDR